MSNIVKNFPFTSLLGLFGLVVGLFFPFVLDFSLSIDYNSVEFLRNPINSFMNYFKDSFGILIKGTGLGIAVGAILGLAGFIIDISRKAPDPVIA